MQEKQVVIDELSNVNYKHKDILEK